MTTRAKALVVAQVATFVFMAAMLLSALAPFAGHISPTWLTILLASLGVASGILWSVMAPRRGKR
jgi:uncharacterized membrane protein YgaE (UPF0421/DUF939 family)